MYYGIVPGRYDPRILEFTRVPGRRNEGIRSVEDHERMRVGCNIPPQRIRAGDVAVKRRSGRRGPGNEKGIWLASKPLVVAVTSVPRG
jgi:hypothetical protein